MQALGCAGVYGRWTSFPEPGARLLRRREDPPELYTVWPQQKLDTRYKAEHYIGTRLCWRYVGNAALLARPLTWPAQKNRR